MAALFLENYGFLAVVLFSSQSWCIVLMFTNRLSAIKSTRKYNRIKILSKFGNVRSQNNENLKNRRLSSKDEKSCLYCVNNNECYSNGNQEMPNSKTTFNVQKAFLLFSCCPVLIQFSIVMSVIVKSIQNIQEMKSNNYPGVYQK